MKKDNRKGRSHHVALSVLLFGITVLLSATGGGLATAGDDVSMCDFSSYLQEPGPRARYIAMRNVVRRGNMDRANWGGVNGGIIPASFSNGQNNKIDEISKACLECHNGIGGKLINASLNEKGSPHVAGMTSIVATHPLGADYYSASLVRLNLKKMDDLPPTMMLVDGRMSCVTCHDPLNREKKHLSVKNDGSALCFSCHSV